VSESFAADRQPVAAPAEPVDGGVERAVRAAGEQLAAVEGAPAAAHVATYDEVHAVLQDALADLDEH
jgi:hypothetical protein